MSVPIFFGIVDQIAFPVNADRRKGGGASHGMAVVGEAAEENFVLEMLRDVMAHAPTARVGDSWK